MIEATQVTKRYGGFLALDDVSFCVEKGRVAGFLGLNGAGKTTALRIASCYMPPTSGSIKVAGFDTVRESDEVRRRIGYLPERVPLYDDLRVDEYLRFRARLKGVRGRETKAAVEHVIDRCGLDPKRRAPIGTLSKGYRQRVGVADALVHSPELLLLDEPTSGLDPDQRLEVRGLVRELSDRCTVLVSTHILPEAEATCDDVVVIHRGQIKAADRLDRLRESEASMFSVRHDGPRLEQYGEGTVISGDDDNVNVNVQTQEAASRIAAEVIQSGRNLLELTEKTPTLEEIFIKLTTGREDGA